MGAAPVQDPPPHGTIMTLLLHAAVTSGILITTEIRLAVTAGMIMVEAEAAQTITANEVLHAVVVARRHLLAPTDSQRNG